MFHCRNLGIPCISPLDASLCDIDLAFNEVKDSAIEHPNRIPPAMIIVKTEVKTARASPPVFEDISILNS